MLSVLKLHRALEIFLRNAPHAKHWKLCLSFEAKIDSDIGLYLPSVSYVSPALLEQKDQDTLASDGWRWNEGHKAYMWSLSHAE